MKAFDYRQLPSARLDATFAALANPTRRAILARLASGSLSVTELAQPFSMSQPAISVHLKVLERAGLVTRGRDAQRRPVRVAPKPLDTATAWLDGYREALEQNFRRLDTVLEEMTRAAASDPPARSERTTRRRAKR
jgi:DNA-binding transcriptional ArsR family regulator